MVEQIKTPADLEKIRTLALQKTGLRVDSSQTKSSEASRRQILVCVGGGCLASGALEICSALRDAIEANDLSKKAEVIETGCMGPCAAGPVAKVMPDNVFYQGITPEDAKTIVEQHIGQGQVVSHLLYRDAENGKPVADIDDIVYFQKQNKIVLRNSGNIDPLKIS
ncbi:MAG TPA: (2Fe-2S) ferredoxin domain-containing protein, partial [Tichowtungia sp.]|nr:(2Fe-2S) ferredoxin domain-containing protein [Tichowtungia sp.]